MSGTYSKVQGRRVQKNSITLAILEEFLVISIFHENKIPNGGYKGPGVF
jgi:hypothetical protein